jgi:hypothetical protein
MVTTTSALASASGMEAAPTPPAATCRSTAAGLTSVPTTRCPALTRLAAMGPPMLPRPMKAMVLMQDAIGDGRRQGPRRDLDPALQAGQHGEIDGDRDRRRQQPDDAAPGGGEP